MDITGGALEVARKQFADVILEHVERPISVEAENDVVQTVRHHMGRADRKTALGQAGGHLDAGCEENAGNPAAGNIAGDLRLRAPGRRQAADQKPGRPNAQTFYESPGPVVVGIAMYDAERGRSGIDPGFGLGGQFLDFIENGGEHEKTVLGHPGRHGHRRRAVEEFHARRTNADSCGADPVVDAGGLAEIGEDGAHILGDNVSDVQKPQQGLALVLGEVLAAEQAVNQGPGDSRPAFGIGMGIFERCHYRDFPRA